MNDDLIRLSDFVPEYAHYHEVSILDAAYDLHKLIENLFREYVLVRGKALPEQIWCVGGAKCSQRSNNGYELDFGALRKYFKDLVESPEASSQFISCFSRTDSNYAKIPAGVVFFYRSTFAEWIDAVGIEPPNFLLSSKAPECSEGVEEDSVFQEKELVSIRMIVSGLIDLIREVNNAHAENPLDNIARKRAEDIIRVASRLNSTRTNFDRYPVIISLAETAGVDMRKSPKTIKWYAEDQ